MKNWFIILLLIFFSSCRSKNSSSFKKTSDTLSVEFSEYMFKNGPFRLHKQILIKQFTKDSTSYSYYDSLGTTLLRSYSLITDNDQIEINTNYPTSDYGNRLGLVYEENTIDTLQLLKYQILNPPLDGDGAIVICPEYGIVGQYSYTWRISNILTKWGEQEVPSQLVGILNSDKFISTTKLPK